MLYRILTEEVFTRYDFNSDLCNLVSQLFTGFTVLYGNGHYKGKSELSVVIEIDTQNRRDEIFELARRIKQEFKQECVLVQMLNCTTKEI